MWNIDKAKISLEQIQRIPEGGLMNYPKQTIAGIEFERPVY